MCTFIVEHIVHEVLARHLVEGSHLACIPRVVQRPVHLDGLAVARSRPPHLVEQVDRLDDALLVYAACRPHMSTRECGHAHMDMNARMHVANGVWGGTNRTHAACALAEHGLCAHGRAA